MSTPSQARFLDLIPKWWPVFLAILAVGASAVRADARLNHTDRQVAELEARVSTAPERLARIEAILEAQKAQLDRIEGRLEQSAR